MYECKIKNIETGEWDLIYTHYPNEPFKDNATYDSQLWEIWSVIYVD